MNLFVHLVGQQENNFHLVSLRGTGARLRAVRLWQSVRQITKIATVAPLPRNDTHLCNNALLQVLAGTKKEMVLKRLFYTIGLTALLMGSVATRADAQQRENMPLKIMTYNLRYASATPPHTWAERRPVAHAMLQQEAPDIIGTQEGYYAVVKNIAADNPALSWIGTGRDGGSRGEFNAIFYRSARLEPLEYDHFWLSDTPDRVGSTSWGNTNRRMVTWVKFRDLQTQREFYFWNTHLDHEIQIAREKGAALIAQRVQELKTSLPVLLVGDFNAAARGNKAYDILLESGFSDTWFAAAQRGPDVATFHGYKPTVPNGVHIDWILSRGEVKTEETHIVTFQQDNQLPSDHFPVAARVLIGETATTP